MASFARSSKSLTKKECGRIERESSHRDKDCQRRRLHSLTKRVMASSKQLQIRGGRKERLLGSLLGKMMRGYAKLLRVEFIDRVGVSQKGEVQRPCIFALWHNRVMMAPQIHEYLGERQVTVLTSASKDGLILEKAVAQFGLKSVRGSSSRRAVAALIALKKIISQGDDICITPDGPRGPMYHLQSGVSKLAQITGALVLPVSVQYEHYWELRTWDHFRIPKPFSKVYLCIEAGLELTEGGDQDQFEEQLQHLMSAS